MAVFVRLRGKGVAALKPLCTCRPESGCPVRWVETSQRFICPCHGSVYDERGAAMAGPAKGRLERLPATVDGDTVFIG